jgi:DHA1 family bicyclomycin/chloramphenicol resistance-like MFS transporter
VAPLVGVLGNTELALAAVMTTAVVVALLALVTVIRRTEAAPA